MSTSASPLFGLALSDLGQDLPFNQQDTPMVQQPFSREKQNKADKAGEYLARKLSQHPGTTRFQGNL